MLARTAQKEYAPVRCPPKFTRNSVNTEIGFGQQTSSETDAYRESIRAQKASLKRTLADLKLQLQLLEDELLRASHIYNEQLGKVTDTSIRMDGALSAFATYVGLYASELVQPKTLCLHMSTGEQLISSLRWSLASTNSRIQAQQQGEKAATEGLWLCNTGDESNNHMLARLASSVCRIRIRRIQVEALRRRKTTSLNYFRRIMTDTHDLHNLKSMHEDELQSMLVQRKSEAERLRMTIQNLFSRQLHPCINICSERELMFPIVLNALTTRSKELSIVRRILTPLLEECLGYIAIVHCFDVVSHIERSMLSVQNRTAQAQLSHISSLHDAVLRFTSSHTNRHVQTNKKDTDNPLLRNLSFLLLWELPQDNVHVTQLLISLYPDGPYGRDNASLVLEQRASHTTLCKRSSALAEHLINDSRSLQRLEDEATDMLHEFTSISDTLQTHWPKLSRNSSSNNSLSTSEQYYSFYRDQSSSSSIPNIHILCTQLSRRTNIATTLVKQATDLLNAMMRDNDPNNRAQLSHLLHRNYSGYLWKREIAWRFLHEPSSLESYVHDLLVKEKVWRDI